jgi:hypothetical protein
MVRIRATAVRFMSGLAILAGSVLIPVGATANASQATRTGQGLSGLSAAPGATLDDPAGQPKDGFGESVSEDSTAAIVGATAPTTTLVPHTYT